MRWIAYGLAGLVTFVVVTAIALEGVSEVVVLRTRDAAGATRETRTWIAEADQAYWVEAAGPDRPFLADLRRDPRLELVRGDRIRACTAIILDDPTGHTRIRALLRERYRWADWWIGLLADTHDSRALRLACAA